MDTSVLLCLDPGLALLRQKKAFLVIKKGGAGLSLFAFDDPLYC